MIQYFNAPDGTRLAYRDEGTGLPVLCLAGLTRNGHDFDHLAPHLGDVRLIRLDYRGRGESDWADPETYTIPIEGQDALALLDHLGVAKATIIGTSRGGLIGMMLAAVAKERLLGLCLNDIGPVIEPEGLAAIKTYIGKNPSAKTFDELALLRARMLPGFVDVPPERWREEARANYRQTEAGLINRYDPDLAIVFNRPAPEGDAWPLFDALADLPVALVRGENSNILSEKTAEMMRNRRPELHYSNVSNRGHVPFLDEPEAVEVIRAWLMEMQ